MDSSSFSVSPPAAPLSLAGQFLHLRAAAAALLTVVLLISSGVIGAHYLEARYIHGVAPALFTLKNQGVAFQKAAFAQNDLLPLYGSSELIREIPDKASRFFRHYPSNFGIFPVGKAGTTPLLILQKLGASVPESHDKKVVISLSPSWFFNESINPGHYAGNFSALQAGEFVFNRHLSFELRRDVAARMLKFPKTLDKEPLLNFAVKRLAGKSGLDRVLFEGSSLAGIVSQAIGRTQDHFQAAFYIWINHVHSSPARRPENLNWAQLLEKASKNTAALSAENARPDAEFNALLREGDHSFISIVESADEWGDLELLLRGMCELHMRPLVFTMPMNGPYFDQIGISPEARAAYYKRLHELAARYETPVVDFRDHEEDAKFLIDHHDHLSVKGWMYYDEVIDRFFHNRLN